MAHVIGVDVGSQSVKGVLLDPDGATLATAGHPCRMSHPASGYAEQDPASWLTGLAEVVPRLLAAAGVAPGEVRHLCLACQVDGVVPVDRELRPLRDAIIWLDRRAGEQTRRLVERLGADEIFATTGLNPDASHIAPKLMWLRDHEPRTYTSAAYLPPVAGYLLGRLTGTLAQDPANASSTLLYDVTAGTWSAKLLEASGIDEALLPVIRPSTDVAGTLTGDAADLLGLTTECAVLVGTGDEHGGSLAAGAVRPGLVADVTGTAEPVTAASSEPVFDPGRVVETHAHAAPGLLLVENPGFVSGGSTLWLADTVLGMTQAELFAAAAAAPVGAEGALFLPTLSGATAPRWNDAMRGSFAGLSMNHDAGHLARAVLEGCAFALRDIVTSLAVLGLADGEVRVIGGGGRSPLWMQIKADVTSRPVRRVHAEEATATGAAMLAGIAAGTFTGLADAVAAAVHLDEPYLPDEARAARYDESYRRYLSLYDGIEGALT